MTPKAPATGVLSRLVAVTSMRVGCAMWAHRPWIGRWYPANTKSGDELGYYARLCNAVEGNTTFYAEPSTQTVQRWVDATPKDFRFAFKLPRTVTHERRLQDVREPVRNFLDRILPLGERIGPVQVQLPPAFGPAGWPVLEAFVRRLPSDLNWVIEVREVGWFDGSDVHKRLDELLRERNFGRVVLDTRPLYAAPATSDAAVEERANKPRLPVRTNVMGPYPVVRVIGQDSSEGTLQGALGWVPEIITWLAEGREPYVFVHQPENLDSPELARKLHDVVRQRVATVAALPSPIAVESNEQGQLFGD